MKRFFIFGIMLCLLLTIFCASPCLSFAESEVDLTCKSACLVDYESGTMLFSHNPKEHLPIASMVKMMTILLTLDEFDKGNLKEDTHITTTENASSMGGSQVFIDPYVEYTAGDLLKSVVISSANDASVALAEHISGSEKAFVAKMNERAKELKMDNSHFINTTGLYEDEHVTTLKDIKKLVIDLYADEVAYDILSTFEYVTGDEKYYSSLYHLGMDDYETVEILGGKTGYTYESKQNIMVLYRHGAYTFCMLLAEADGEEGGQYHAADVYTILDYLYAF